MVQDYRVVGNSLYSYLRPAIVNEKEIGQRSDSITTGNCIHLGPQGCNLKREEMPTGCVIALPCVTRGEMTEDKFNMHMMWITCSPESVSNRLFQTLSGTYEFMMLFTKIQSSIQMRK